MPATPGASACLIRDGQLIAAAEEERFKRVKYCAGFPTQAIRWCLDMKDVLNARIKHREKFRPIAPSILAEATGAYFDPDYPDPFVTTPPAKAGASQATARAAPTVCA